MHKAPLGGLWKHENVGEEWPRTCGEEEYVTLVAFQSLCDLLTVNASAIRWASHAHWTKRWFEYPWSYRYPSCWWKALQQFLDQVVALPLTAQRHRPTRTPKSPNGWPNDWPSLTFKQHNFRVLGEGCRLFAIEVKERFFWQSLLRMLWQLQRWSNGLPPSLNLPNNLARHSFNRIWRRNKSWLWVYSCFNKKTTFM